MDSTTGPGSASVDNHTSPPARTVGPSLPRSGSATSGAPSRRVDSPRGNSSGTRGSGVGGSGGNRTWDENGPYAV